MSAIPVLRPPSVGTRRRRSHRVAATPAQLRSGKARPRRRLRDDGLLAARLLSFAIVAAAVFIGSSLFGQVMVEKARREGLQAIERARAARRAESVLRQEVDGLGSLGSVEAWAASHSFVTPEGAVNGVAKR